MRSRYERIFYKEVPIDGVAERIGVSSEAVMDSLLRKQGVEEVTPESAYARAELSDLVRASLVELPERERLILEHRHGFHGEELTLEAIGALLDLSRERVRQLERDAKLKIGRAIRFAVPDNATDSDPLDQLLIRKNPMRYMRQHKDALVGCTYEVLADRMPHLYELLEQQPARKRNAEHLLALWREELGYE